MMNLPPIHKRQLLNRRWSYADEKLYQMDNFLHQTCDDECNYLYISQI